MRVLIFHGYLLSGTGSNVYNARLAEALVRAGHEVHLLCQDAEAGRLDFVDATGEWQGDELRVEGARDARCTVYRPDIGGLLPVYVADRYPGFEARPFPECSDEEIERYVSANVEAVRQVAERARPEAALANHLVMGPVVLARGLRDSGIGYAVKVHGSALEYTVRPHRDRFLGAAREGLAGAAGVLVGSRHTAESLWSVMDDERLPERTRLGPPGVDVARFAPREADQAHDALSALTRRLSDLPAVSGDVPSDAFTRDPRAAGRALQRLDPAQDRLVVFVGKLIVNKGVDLLLAAWPLVLASVPAARLVVVGFGSYRDGLERLLSCLADGDVEGAQEVARQGRALEQENAGSAPAQPLRMLAAFLDGLSGPALDQYVAAAQGLREQVVFTGRLEHDELSELLPACESLVFPSTFPEAFGMVAVEAAACGALPISAAHSGLEEVSRELAAHVPSPADEWLSFPLNDRVVPALGDRLIAWLRAPDDLRSATREALVTTARERWSWDGVARSVLAAAAGRLDDLPRVASREWR